MANIARKHRLHLVRVVYRSLCVNQSQAVRAEILVRTRVLLIVNRIATRTVRIIPATIST